MSPADFRKELVKIMPGYQWTIHRSINSNSCLVATGIQSSGFNRISTIRVVKRKKDGKTWYEAKSAGFGRQSPWLSEAVEGTLARALRSLQNHYEQMAQKYRVHASALERARKCGDES